MDRERIKDFTRKITNGNRSELVVIKYEILFCYMQDALNAKANNNREAFKTGIRNADLVLNSFLDTLDYKYELALHLHTLYVYCKEQLAQAMYSFSENGIRNANKVLNGLYEAFEEVAKKDNSKPLMQNTQQVIAGMTYGKNQINENVEQMDLNRGFYI